MTEQEQRIAIAQWCGWTMIWQAPIDGWRGCCPTGSGHLHANLPDYLRDLNAMHEAEMRLDDTSFDFYRMELQKSGRDIRATAHQRAEALLRAIGKWKD